MNNSLFENLLSEGLDRAERQQPKTRTRSMRETAAAEEANGLEDGFYWHRIRRMSKKG